jgi:hypothetical protein
MAFQGSIAFLFCQERKGDVNYSALEGNLRGMSELLWVGLKIPIGPQSKDLWQEKDRVLE